MSDVAPPAGRLPAPELRFALPDPAPWRPEVVDLLETTPAVRSVRVRVTGAGTFDYAPGQDLALTLPGLDGQSVRRRYSIAAFETDEGVATLDIVAHGDGPGARFLAAARPGDVIEAFGPRGKITLVAGARTHLFIGDEASYAAIASLVASLAPGERAIVVLDVASPSEHRPISAPDGVGLELHHLDRGDAAAEDPTRVLRTLELLEFDVESTHAYAFGEFHVVLAARRALGPRLSPARLSPKPYWRSGQANGGHGEPPRDE